MYNQSELGTTGSCAVVGVTERAENRKNLTTFDETFRSEINILDGLICEIKNQVNSIKRIEVPVEIVNSSRPSDEPNDILGEMFNTLDRLTTYNTVLSTIRDHLNKAI